MTKYLLLLVSLLFLDVECEKNFDLCCSIKAFNIEPCMIKDGRRLDIFESKDTIAEFPITNSTQLLDCRMHSDEEASYYIDFASTTLTNMRDPGIDIAQQGMVNGTTTKFTVNFTCLKSQKTFIKVDVLLKYFNEDDEKSDKQVNHIFYLAKNCSMPTLINIITDNKTAMILYAVCGVLALFLVLVIIISIVCYIRIRRRSNNQKLLGSDGGGIPGMTMNVLHPNGYAPLPDNQYSTPPHPSQQSGYNPYNTGPGGGQPSIPSLHSSNQQKMHPVYGYSSGEGSFLSEPHHNKMAGGGLLPPAYPNGHNASPDLKIPRGSVVFDTFLKSGSIGITYLATYTRDAALNQRSTVFAKTLKEESSNRETVTSFLRDAVILELVAHPNILSVTGIVEEGFTKPPIAIYPYMKGGNLHNLLHMARPSSANPNTLTLADQIHMMICVARGMEALSKTGNAHGDLAARNCVVGNDLVVKIADSALSRDLFPNDYHDLPGRAGFPKLPIKWMSIEVLTDLMYSTMSDVWAFGVTFWEVLTFGEVPYIDVQPNDMVKHLQGGWRLMQPDVCTDELFTLLVRCWAISPEDRMSFSNVLAQLEALQCKGAMGLYRPSALEAILKPPQPTSPPATPMSDSDQIQV